MKEKLLFIVKYVTIYHFTFQEFCAIILNKGVKQSDGYWEKIYT